MKHHYIIPVFIPEKACPFRCVYCNQYNITNRQKALEPESVKLLIDRYLEFIPPYAHTKVGFFGGSFTGLSIEEQNHYLDIVQPYIEQGRVAEIQLSTRPDYISRTILDNLLSHHVTTIELGAQSLDDDVLRLSGRGHTVQDVEKASELILSYHFKLGLQMMIGLPGDTPAKALSTAQKIIELGASCTRIYPALVIKDTDLAEWFRAGKYTPLSLHEAVCQALEVMELFEEHHVKILRVGLHPSEGLLNRETLVAGPFHVSFKELVLTEKWRRKFESMMDSKEETSLQITVNPMQINAAVGYHGANRKWLLKHFVQVEFRQDNAIPMDDFKWELLGKSLKENL